MRSHELRSIINFINLINLINFINPINIYQPIHSCCLMRNRRDRANRFTDHTGNFAGRLYGDRIEIADKSSLLRANGHTNSTFNTGIPGDGKNNGQ